MPCSFCDDSGILFDAARFHPGRTFEVDNAGRCYNCNRYRTGLEAMRALAGQGSDGGFIVWTECYSSRNRWQTFYVRTDPQSAADLQRQLLEGSVAEEGVPTVISRFERVPKADLDAGIVRPIVQKAAQAL